jgi:hypothetical protein
MMLLLDRDEAGTNAGRFVRELRRGRPSVRQEKQRDLQSPLSLFSWRGVAQLADPSSKPADAF